MVPNIPSRCCMLLVQPSRFKLSKLTLLFKEQKVKSNCIPNYTLTVVQNRISSPYLTTAALTNVLS